MIVHILKDIIMGGLIDIFKTAFQVIKSPTKFYSEVSKPTAVKGFAKPFIFLILMLVTSHNLLWSILGVWSIWDAIHSHFKYYDAYYLHWYQGLGEVWKSLLAPFGMFIFSFTMFVEFYPNGHLELLLGFIAFTIILTTILFVIWKVSGSKQSYVTSFSAVAYTSALLLIWMPSWFIVPYGFYIVGLPILIWEMYLLIVVSRQVHNVGLLPALISGLIGGVLIFTVVYSTCYYWTPAHGVLMGK
ncbi:MAG: hypothetical protein HY762_05825 [Planctomycetes bacterium]|nr:hypothetical protein [Planctomycetota bacterium]